MPIVKPLRAIAATLLAAAPGVAAAQMRPPAPSPSARVTFQLDSARLLHFSARGFELRVGQSGTPSAAGDAQIELTKNADPITPDLIRLAGTRSVVPGVVVEVLDSLAAPVMTVRLTGAVITSDRVTLSTARAALEQQRISQQEALSQLTTDSQEADRELATAEELGKTRTTTRQELARARDRASDLKQRLELLRLRQALLTRQLDAVGPVDEVVALRFQRMEIEGRDPATRSSVDFGTRPPGAPRG